MLTLNGQTLDITLFPDNTSQVWKIDDALLNASAHTVVWDFSSEADLLHLAQLKALLDLQKKPAKLEITYLPYARQDKETANNATFALRPFAKLLNTLDFDDVILHDPHSSVALTEIRNSRAVYPLAKVEAAVARTESDLICYPDKGARERYSKIYPFSAIHGEKVRDQQSGRITSYQVVGHPQQRRVMIIDDICDGGATFVLLARELIKQGAKEVNLFVTHGLFSKGLADMHAAGVTHIFTAEGEAFETQNQISYKEQ